MTETKRFVFAFEQHDSHARQQYEFPHRTQMQVTHDFDVDCTWDTVLRQFIQFLSGVYGYDISESVSYETLEEKLDRLRQTHYDPYEGEDCDDPDCSYCNNDK